MTKDIVKISLRDTLPVLSGYLVLGLGFGVLMKASGYGFWWSVSMSIFIYAGSMQFAGLGLITGGASLLTVALTTLAVNARHFFYGLSMIDRYKGTGAVRPYLIYALTDETYSLVCSGEKSREYYVLVSVLDQIYWVGGTALGALMGSALRFDTKGIDFAMTALFITVFTDQWLNSTEHFPAVAGVGISVLCLLLFGADSFLIPAMLLITAALLLLMGKEALHE